MLIRSRSARFAALALAAVTPLVASYAAPALAAGDDAAVSATFPQSGYVHVTSTKGLSRVTVVLCDGSFVVADSWSGALSGDVGVDGAVRAVFIHSGNNTTDEAQALLEDLAPGAVSGNSTGTIAFEGSCGTSGGGETTGGGTNNGGGENAGGGSNNGGGENAGGGSNNGGGENAGGGSRDDNGDPNDGTNNGATNGGGTNNGGDHDTTVSSTDTSDPAPVTTTAGPSSDPAPETTVLGVTIEKASNPAPASALAPAVDGSNLEVHGELPRTGAGNIPFLTTLALSLLAAGLTLRAAFGRRIRSASSPG